MCLHISPIAVQFLDFLSLVPYSIKAVIKNKKTGGVLKNGILKTPPRYLSRLISRLPGLVNSKSSIESLNDISR